jgi:hypothetical protein
VALTFPSLFSFIRLSNDAKAEHHTGQFLDWVLEKRKAECFLELHRSKIGNSNIKTIVKNASEANQQYYELIKSHEQK